MATRPVCIRDADAFTGWAGPSRPIPCLIRRWTGREGRIGAVCLDNGARARTDRGEVAVGDPAPGMAFAKRPVRPA